MEDDGLRRAVADHYGRHSERYQRFENPRSQAQAAPMLDALPLGTAARVLDVGTGPGTLIPLLEQRARTAAIVGFDASEGALARAKAASGARVAVADSLRLPVGSGTADVVTFSFSLFHLSSPSGGLREAHRVLRDGGTVGILTHDGTAANTPAEARALIASLIEQLPGFRTPPPVDETATPGRVGELLEEEGFTEARIWTATTDEQHERDGAELLARARSQVPDLPAADWEAFESSALEQLAALDPDDFRYRLRFVYAVARRA